VVELFALSGARLARYELAGGKAHFISEKGLPNGRYVLQVARGPELLSRALMIVR
jgi:hypothetical protein